MIRLAALVLIAAALWPIPARADDRVAVEILKGETPRDAALAFERACYRLGVTQVDADPVQLFDHDGRSYVRLVVNGPPAVSRCVTSLDPGRSGVTGIVHWIDGFKGGLVVNRANAREDRVPDSEWLSPGPKITQPPVDGLLVDQLVHGGSEAIDKVLAMDLDTALAQVRALRARGGPGAIAALEVIARKAPHWRVRRCAVEGLGSGVTSLASVQVLIQLARSDTAPEVREAAVTLLQAVANPPIPTANAPSPEAANVLLDVLDHDSSWLVRRRILWSLTRELIERGHKVIERIAAHDPEPQVRAAALTALAGDELVSHNQLTTLLSDPTPEVRAVAANALASTMEESDAPALWGALNDAKRTVRVAAVPFVTRISDPTIGPRLWQLYLQESNELDADLTFERAILDELARAPYPALSHDIQIALASRSLSPDERRVLTRTLSQVDAAKAALMLEPALRSADARARALAATAAPATPAIQARRLELLSDPDPDVRASAILGLCHAPHVDAATLSTIRTTELEDTPLSREAAALIPRCGRVLPAQYFQTTLAVAKEERASTDPATLPAVAAMALMVVSMLLEKLFQKPQPAAPAEHHPADG